MEQELERLTKWLDRMVARAIRNAPSPTLENLDDAHTVFLENEPRDLFYRAATHLVGYAVDGGPQFTLGEALAVLLQTWNREYYRYRGFTNEHLAQIEELLASEWPAIDVYRGRDLASFTPNEQIAVLALVIRFSDVLGPVGAGKALHLLAPRFFPLWDRKIAARAYRVDVNPVGYVAVMRAVQMQCETLIDRFPFPPTLLKRLDEYNYCRYSKEWLK